jgi:acetoin utilization protein AcuC
MPRRLHVYADPELGAYGYEEKAWYLPGARLEAFLDEARARGLTETIDFVSAGPATDAQLQSFHTAAYVASVVSHCAKDEGSLDGAVAPIVQDAVRLLKAVSEAANAQGAASESVVRAQLAATLVPAMSFDTYMDYLGAEQLLVHDATASTIRLGAGAGAFLGSANPRLTGPTLARVGVERAARWICGAALDATRRILAGDYQRVFIPVAGFHHAHAAEARMYCLYNDPVLAIRHALGQLSGTVAYIDIDIHQGDGVYEAFVEEPRVVIADLHEDPSTLFPYTPEQPSEQHFPGRREDHGRGAGAGRKLNIALAPQTTDAEYLALWAEAEAFVRAAKPQFIVFESGVDGLASDPLSNQSLSTKAIDEVTRRVCALADESAGGRLLVLGGGGYELEGTKRGWCTVVEALLST